MLGMLLGGDAGVEGIADEGIAGVLLAAAPMVSWMRVASVIMEVCTRQ